MISLTRKLYILPFRSLYHDASIREKAKSIKFSVDSAATTSRQIVAPDINKK